MCVCVRVFRVVFQTTDGVTRCLLYRIGPRAYIRARASPNNTRDSRRDRCADFRRFVRPIRNVTRHWWSAHRRHTNNLLPAIWPLVVRCRACMSSPRDRRRTTWSKRLFMSPPVSRGSRPLDGTQFSLAPDSGPPTPPARWRTVNNMVVGSRAFFRTPPIFQLGRLARSWTFLRLFVSIFVTTSSNNRGSPTVTRLTFPLYVDTSTAGLLRVRGQFSAATLWERSPLLNRLRATFYSAYARIFNILIRTSHVRKIPASFRRQYNVPRSANDTLRARFTHVNFTQVNKWQLFATCARI